MYYAVFFDILPQHVVAFAQGLTEEAAAVEHLESKTARFHLWQNTTDASRWVVLEAFREAAGCSDLRRFLFGGSSLLQAMIDKVMRGIRFSVSI